jgi:hypothetical protein
MSYDISLYEPNFLRSAVASNLGDWRAAPALNTETKNAIVHAAQSEGFVATPHLPGFVEFMQSQGATPSSDFRLTTPQLNLALQLFESSVVLAVHPSAVASASASFARSFGKRLAKELGLGFYDPQVGEMLLVEV